MIQPLITPIPWRLVPLYHALIPDVHVRQLFRSRGTLFEDKLSMLVGPANTNDGWATYIKTEPRDLVLVVVDNRVPITTPVTLGLGAWYITP